MVNYASKHTTNKQTVSTDEAKTIALNFVRFLAQDEERIGRFQGLTGMDVADIKNCLAASDMTFLGNTLDYALSDEALLLQFASSESLDPTKIALARRQLPGHTDYE
jgi:hypothetical protein